MLSKDCIVDVSAHLLARAEAYLLNNSFGLEIMCIDVGQMMAQTPAGMRPMWGIVYKCRGILLGSENYNTQLTAVNDPFISDEALHKSLDEGCAMLRESRSSQGNGAHK